MTDVAEPFFGLGGDPDLTERVRELEAENLRLRLAVALLQHSRGRGRPRKRIATKITAGRPGRPRSTDSTEWGQLLAGVERVQRERQLSSRAETVRWLAAQLNAKRSAGGLKRWTETEVRQQVRTILNGLSASNRASRKLIERKMFSTRFFVTT